jgi:hypothetical protein
MAEIKLTSKHLQVTKSLAKKTQCMRTADSDG